MEIKPEVFPLLRSENIYFALTSFKISLDNLKNIMVKEVFIIKNMKRTQTIKYNMIMPCPNPGFAK